MVNSSIALVGKMASSKLYIRDVCHRRPLNVSGPHQTSRSHGSNLPYLKTCRALILAAVSNGFLALIDVRPFIAEGRSVDMYVSSLPYEGLSACCFRSAFDSLVLISNVRVTLRDESTV